MAFTSKIRKPFKIEEDWSLYNTKYKFKYLNDVISIFWPDSDRSFPKMIYYSLNEITFWGHFLFTTKI